MRTSILRAFRAGIAALFMSAATLSPIVPAAAVHADGNLTWGVQGANYANPGCQTGQTANWHWVFTPGGNGNVTSATLHITYTDATTATVVGSQNGNGSYSFNATKSAPATVQSAYVTYQGTTGNGNTVLTISSSSCTGTATTSVTPLPVTFSEACGAGGDTYTIPSTTGVNYYVNSSASPTAAGTYSGFGIVSVTASAQSGYTLSGTTSWMHLFMNMPCIISVTPTAPSFNDVCGTANDTYTIPSTTGISYFVNGAATATSAGTYTGLGTVGISAQAQFGYMLSGTSSWSYSFTNSACPISVTPTAPTFSDACGTNNDIYTIPTTTGVNYYINGSSTAATARTYPGIGSITVTAQAKSGYALSGTTSWSHTFTNDTCPITQVTPTPVTFNDFCGTANDTYTVPSTENVSYWMNEELVEAGTYPATGTVTITATADEGSNVALTGTTSWSHTFTNDSCTPIVTPVTPPTTITPGQGGSGQVLGSSTTISNVLPVVAPVQTVTAPAATQQELVNTGSSVLQGTIIGLALLGSVGGLTVATRRKVQL